ncbi:cyclic nucleotide-binding domain-containing protein [Magnetovibrio sp. PR-2]|uniref:cyclic nucleotide-binding domain-containing protein n=1 Tax=Magnetovibrio sp. PR-2 TaxID=3120356 RepID=UPI002FCE2A2B
MRKVLYILGQLSDEDVDWLSQNGTRKRAAQGDVLIAQGKPLSDMYIILDGKMSASIKGLGKVADLGSGEIVGEMSFIDSRPPSASIIVEEDATVLALSQDVINQKLLQDIGFAARFYKALATFLSDRMRGTVQTMGYGDNDGGLDDEIELEGELDLNVLDSVHLAGARFDRMLKKLIGA